MPDNKQSETDRLVLAAKRGDQAAQDRLIEMYRGLVGQESRAYFMLGADPEDVAQEGMIGLFKAIRGYDPGAGASFSTFARVCINRQIKDAVRAAGRKKHEALNHFVSINEDEGARALERHAATAATSAESGGVWDGSSLWERIAGEWRSEFSDLEYKVFVNYMAGLSCSETAEKLNCKPKTVYNAMGRLKRKIRVLLDREDG